MSGVVATPFAHCAVLFVCPILDLTSCFAAILPRCFLCIFLVVYFQSTDLEHSPLPLFLKCIRVVLSTVGSIDVSSSCSYDPSSLAVVRYHCRLVVLFVLVL